MYYTFCLTTKKGESESKVDVRRELNGSWHKPPAAKLTNISGWERHSGHVLSVSTLKYISKILKIPNYSTVKNFSKKFW